MASNGGDQKLPGVTGGTISGKDAKNAADSIGKRRGDFTIVVSGFGRKKRTTTEALQGTATISGPPEAIHALVELGAKGSITVKVPRRKSSKGRDK